MERNSIANLLSDIPVMQEGDNHRFIHDDLATHPLFDVMVDAINQAMYGKGERHGGVSQPFMDQPWVHYAKMHGRGFLTGQAAKKLEEAASTRHGKQFKQEVLGAIVYAAMAILHEQSEFPHEFN